MALYGIKLLLLQSYKFNQIKKDKIMSIKVVQFLHSGKEYKRSEFIKEREETIKPWNTGDHRRKFLHAKGAYIDNRGKKIGDENNWEDIYFWGEWEPESIVPNINKHGEDAPPHFIHEPFLRLNESKQLIKGDKKSIAKNTDPFVFGDKGFFYSCCKQNRKYKDKIDSTQMQDLEPGSIILFGSNINHNKGNTYFALDTVFVVGDDKNEENPNKQGYNINSYSKDLTKVPDNYFDIMNFEGWKDSLNSTGNEIELAGCNGSICTSNKKESEGCENGSDFTCYRGASFDNPITCKDYPTEKMYSFVPCKIGSKGENGFERIKLSNEDFSFISNNLSQGVKYTEVTLEESFDIWKRLRKIIHKDKEHEFKEAVRLNYT